MTRATTACLRQLRSKPPTSQRSQSMLTLGATPRESGRARSLRVCCQRGCPRGSCPRSTWCSTAPAACGPRCGLSAHTLSCWRSRSSSSRGSGATSRCLGGCGHTRGNRCRRACMRVTYSCLLAEYSSHGAQVCANVVRAHDSRSTCSGLTSSHGPMPAYHPPTPYHGSVSTPSPRCAHTHSGRLPPPHSPACPPAYPPTAAR